MFIRQTGKISLRASCRAVWLVLLLLGQANGQQSVLVDDFHRADSLYHGHGWETLNPGCWKIEDRALRRRLRPIMLLR